MFFNLLKIFFTFDCSASFDTSVWLIEILSCVSCFVSVIFSVRFSSTIVSCWFDKFVSLGITSAAVPSKFSGVDSVVTFSKDGCSGWFCSFSFSACTSSNHFSKIGIASSKFGVPDDEIFCFPSIYSLPTQFFDFNSPLYLSCLI